MSSAVLSGIAYKTIDTGGGRHVTAEQVARVIAPDVVYDVDVVDLVCVENTRGSAGGRVFPIEDIRASREVAREAGVPVHLDGARIFNASVASGVPVSDYAAQVDTLMFCVSKGLGAPIGSLVCGTAEAIREARRIKILFGGAWRQAGIVAAAGIVALEEGPRRLHEDHERAGRLARGVAEVLPGAIDPGTVETNIVLVDTEAVGLDPIEVRRRMMDEGVGCTIEAGKVRMVTHLGIDDEDVETALAAWRNVAGAVR
jgi:threonine aldolase